MIDPMDKAAVKTRLENPATRAAALTELGSWVLNTCLLAGSEPATAFSVAGTFVRGIATSYDPPPQPNELLASILANYAPGGRGRYQRKKKSDATDPLPDGTRD